VVEDEKNKENDYLWENAYDVNLEKKKPP